MGKLESDDELFEENIHSQRADVELFGEDFESSFRLDASLRSVLELKGECRKTSTKQAGSESECEVEIGTTRPISVVMPCLPETVECSKLSPVQVSTRGLGCDHAPDQPHSCWCPAVENAKFT
ncbi:hypothetical protein CLCR_06438 [Cladophialophora carrionii]|uniref:Uncharacterized protein n=1 Tax=Cladophialophora carrionii TaxID=86049 RepID=A0A1C1C8B2_9EURO|nr:hypothetical protein CLCR_06438 [Cladophialophora carrionii]